MLEWLDLRLSHIGGILVMDCVLPTFLAGAPLARGSFALWCSRMAVTNDSFSVALGLLAFIG